jgi:hypothetical protein
MTEMPISGETVVTTAAMGDSAAPRSLERLDLVAILLLMTCIVGMFWRVLFTSDMFFFRDIFNYTYPHAQFIQESCRRGALPYWNPYLNFGQPLLANPNFLFFYPYTLFIILLPINLAYTLHYVLHFAVAALGAYLLARRWGQSYTAAFFAALIFTFSGPVLSLGNFYNQVACSVWIPWALLLTERALESRSRRPWILLTLVFALQFLAAEPFTLLATFVLAMAYAFWLKGTRHPFLSPINLRLLGSFTLVGGCVLALCAIQFFPSVALLHNSLRGTQGLPYKETTYWSLHPFSLIEMLIPDFYSSSLSAPSLWTTILSGRNKPYFTSIFVGFVPLFFALVGWALSREQRRHFAAGGALLFLLLAFGRFTPVFALAYLVFPPLALVRFPLKLLIPALLLVAMLAGWGLDALRQASLLAARRRLLLLPLEGLLAAVVSVWLISWVFPSLIEAPAAWVLGQTDELFVRSHSTPFSAADLQAAAELLRARIQLHLPGLAGFSLGAIVWLLSLEHGKRWARRAIPWVALFGLLQLAVVNYDANPTVPKTFYTYRPPVLDQLQKSEEAFRFCYIFRASLPLPPALLAQTFLNFDSIPEIANLPYVTQVSFRDRLLLARGAMLERVEGTSNDDVELAFPPYLLDFWVFTLAQMTDHARSDCLLGRANVKYIVARIPDPSAAKREVAPIFNGSAHPSVLYENLCFVPRASVVGRASYSQSSLETLTRLSEEAHDPESEVILAATPAAANPALSAAAIGKVEIADRQPNQVTLRAELTQPGYVVLRDRFDPNWHATVDGREATILRADQLFRAVYVEAGRHEIRFFYRQAGLKAGLVISLVTLALLTLLFALDPRPDSKRPN